MTISPSQLYEVRQKIARGIGDLVATGTFASVNASAADTRDLLGQTAGQYKGQYLYLFTGGGSGQDRTLMYYTPYSVAGGLARINVLPIWSPVPSLNAQFEMHRMFRAADYNEAIAAAVRKVQRRQLLAKVDTSLSVTADTYEYSLSTSPTGFVYVDEVRFEGDVADVYDELVPGEWWYIDRANKKIVFEYDAFDPDTYAGKGIQVIGQAYPAVPTTETATVDVDNSYVIAEACARLLRSLPAPTDGQRAQAQEYAAVAQGLEYRMATRAHANARPVEDI